MDPCTSNIREQTVSAVSTMDISQHIHLFYLVRELGHEYTQNKNGVFINLSEWSDESVLLLNEKIRELVDTEAGIVNDIDDDATEDSSAETEVALNDMSESAPIRTCYPPVAVEPHLEQQLETTFAFNRKGVQNKYTMVKKKYNKPFVTEIVQKKEGVNELKELEEVPYKIA
jgi:hypothetical protein